MTTANRPVKQPGPDHPITVSASEQRVTVRFAGQVVAETRRALSLQEADYPAVLYVPREDARAELLQRSDTTTYCPFKGEASYYTIEVAGQQAVDAIWTYENPYPAVGEIKDYLAFYPDRVDEISVS